jgi:GTP:adenosylcobinamide-phosphate guanylyltransferase
MARTGGNWLSRSMGEWTAIVLAGQRPGENAFAASHGVRVKALIPVDGEPMLARVLHTLLACPSIKRIVILAQAPDGLLADAPAWIREEPRIGTEAAGDGISTSIAAIAGGETAPWPLLIATADHALLTPEMVETFIAGAAGADTAFAVAERKVVEAGYPETRRTWLKFSDGHFSGANLFALTGPKTRAALDFWARAERDRKKALKMLTFFGPTIFLRALTRTISLDKAAVKVGRALGLSLRPVRLPFAEAAIDVDKPSDLALVERIVRMGRDAGAAPADR